MNRQQIVVIALACLVIGAGAAFFTWCPPEACRVLHIQTYNISTLDDYRRFLRDEAAFTAEHHVRAVRLHCSRLRDEVVTDLNTRRLTVGTSRRNGVAGAERPPDPITAWHQGRLLHLSTTASGNRQVLDAWAMSVREHIAVQQQGDWSFLPQLFGGVIIHVHNRQLPVVLFSDRPCA